jgi:hypothetical protein
MPGGTGRASKEVVAVSERSERGVDRAASPTVVADGVAGGDALEHVDARAWRPAVVRAVDDWLTPRLLSRPAPAGVQAAVLLVMLGLVVAAEAMNGHAAPPTFHPAPLLLAGVVFATVVGGLPLGLASAAMAILYEVGFAIAHHEDAR